ncbi:hypothetical protein GA0116948_11363 [Chitinophaga costaii]|uniref:Uncharacterized protein n=1 Tax=Chitinophaga costaii TaxID=1335309 RepID=A0A1C4FDR0_9BACT|nr:hypothetical protein GA0116948_11363 [Chitinophaga costaii]
MLLLHMTQRVQQALNTFFHKFQQNIIFIFKVIVNDRYNVFNGNGNFTNG